MTMNVFVKAQSESNEIICDRSYHFVITVVESKGAIMRFM